MWHLLHADLKHSGAYLNWIMGVTLGLMMFLTSSINRPTASRFGPNLVLMITFMSIVFFRMKFTKRQKNTLLNSIHLPLSCTQLGLARVFYANIHWLISLVGALAVVAWYTADFQAADWAFFPRLVCIVFCTHALLLTSLDLKYILKNTLGNWVNYLGTTLTFLAAMVFTVIVILPPPIKASSTLLAL